MLSVELSIMLIKFAVKSQLRNTCFFIHILFCNLIFSCFILYYVLLFLYLCIIICLYLYYDVFHTVALHYVNIKIFFTVLMYSKHNLFCSATDICKLCIFCVCILKNTPFFIRPV